MNNYLQFMDFPVELPEHYLKKAEKLEIEAEQIEESFIHGSGAGGQKINKTANCVRLNYLPLDIEIKCQKHRERSKNRISAYKLLIDKIEHKILGDESKIAKKIFKIRKQKQRRSRKAKEKMLEEKHRKSEVKESRRKIQDFGE